MQNTNTGSRERMLPVAIFPTREIGTDPGAIKAFAQGVEGLGFHSILTYEHIAGTPEPSGNNGYIVNDPFHEPFTLFSYLAGVTERIGFMTGVMVTPQREITLVAKQAAEVANLSGGRLHLGIGSGSNPKEFAILGSNYATRGKRIERQIQLLRDLWTKETVTYTETNDHVEPYGISPRPNYKIPIWIGGWAPPVLERTARLADGWIPMGRPEELAELLPDFYKFLVKNGRDPKSFPILGAFGRQFGLNGKEIPPLTADNVEWFDGEFPKLQALDVSHVAFGSQKFGFESVDQHVGYLKKRKQRFDQFQDSN